MCVNENVTLLSLYSFEKRAKICENSQKGESQKIRKGMKIKGFRGFYANEEIIATMLPKPRRRVRFPYPAPKQKRQAASVLESRIGN